MEIVITEVAYHQPWLCIQQHFRQELGCDNHVKAKPDTCLTTRLVVNMVQLHTFTELVPKVYYLYV